MMHQTVDGEAWSHDDAINALIVFPRFRRCESQLEKEKRFMRHNINKVDENLRL